jgi:dihydroorotate dehydrogenase (fumarate)
MDLTTTYLGLNFKSPLVVGAAAPLSEDLDHIKTMEDYGAAGIVLHSLFEEQIKQERLALHHHTEYGTYSFAEALTYFPEPEIFHVGANAYLYHIQKAKESVDIPIIASLNGDSIGGWTDYAKNIEQAGADAIELNVYEIPTDMNKSGAEIEQIYIDLLHAIKDAVNIPVAIKLSPYFSNMANMAKRLTDAGADGLVLFNRFYQPDIDIDELEVTSNVLLSSPHDLRLPMRWIAILYGRLNVDFAATSGINKGQDVLKMMMAGANVTLIVSALLRHGVHHLREMEQEILHWMEEHEYESIKQMQGSMSQINCPDESAFERVQYMKALQTFHPEHSFV